MPIEDTSREQTAHRQHPVPQNIMNVEFKLVGDLTVRQFVYVVLGGVTIFLSFTSHLPFIWKWFFILFGGLGFLAMAFIPFGDRGLDQWIRNFFRSTSTPTQRVWSKNPYLPQYFLSDYADILKSEVVTLAPTRSRKALTDYFEVGKSNNYPADEKEFSFLDKLDFKLGIPESLKAHIKATPIVKQEEERKEEVKIVRTVGTLVPMVAPSPAKVLPAESKPQLESLVVRKPQDMSNISAVTNVEVSRAISGVALGGEIILPKKSHKNEVYTGEVSVGGGKTFEDEHKKDLLKQAKELREMLRKVQERFTPEGAVMPAQELIIESGGDKYKTIISSLEVENKRLAKEIQELTQKIEALAKANSGDAGTLNQYRNKIKELEGERSLVQKTLSEKAEKTDITESLAHTVGIQDSGLQPKEPNVVWGEVRDKYGKLLENATIIVRDAETNDPVRALRTNRLGQFVSSAPLATGRYKIEVLNSENYFDIMEIVLAGSLTKPILLSAKKIAKNA